MRNYSNHTLVYIDQLNLVNTRFNEYFAITAIAIGGPGNLVAMFVFSRLIRRKTNMGLLFTSQCLIDFTALLLMFLVIRGSTLLYGVNVIDKLDSVCEFTVYMRRFLFNMSSWMSVITTFDRFMFVFYEHRFKLIRRKRTLVIIVGATVVLMALLNIPNLFYYVSDVSLCTSSYAIVILSDVISLLFRTYIPLSLMVFFNAMMIRRITRKKHLHASSSSSSSAAAITATRTTTARPARKEYQFTVAVISSDVIFFITHIPLSISYIVFDVYLYMGVLKSDALLLAQLSLTQNIIINYSTLDMVFSLLTYLSFNKQFRKEFVRIVSWPFKVATGASFSRSSYYSEH